MNENIFLIHDYELARYGPKMNGRKLRAYCPVHGGDHQRSLEIRLEDEGTWKRGYGYCHNCKVTIFVIEMNDKRAAWIENHQGQVARPLESTDLLKPRSHGMVEAEEWQQQERALQQSSTCWSRWALISVVLISRGS